MSVSSHLPSWCQSFLSTTISPYLTTLSSPFVSELSCDSLHELFHVYSDTSIFPVHTQARLSNLRLTATALFINEQGCPYFLKSQEEPPVNKRLTQTSIRPSLHAQLTHYSLPRADRPEQHIDIRPVYPGVPPSSLPWDKSGSHRLYHWSRWPSYRDLPRVAVDKATFLLSRSGGMTKLGLSLGIQWFD